MPNLDGNCRTWSESLLRREKGWVEAWWRRGVGKGGGASARGGRGPATRRENENEETEKQGRKRKNWQSERRALKRRPKRRGVGRAPARGRGPVPKEPAETLYNDRIPGHHTHVDRGESVRATSSESKVAFLVNIYYVSMTHINRFVLVTDCG